MGDYDEETETDREVVNGSRLLYTCRDVFSAGITESVCTDKRAFGYLFDDLYDSFFRAGRCVDCDFSLVLEMSEVPKKISAQIWSDG